MERVHLKSLPRYVVLACRYRGCVKKGSPPIQSNTLDAKGGARQLGPGDELFHD